MNSPTGMVLHVPKPTYLQRLVEKALHAELSEYQSYECIGYFKARAQGVPCYETIWEMYHIPSHNAPNNKSQPSSNGGRAVTAFLKLISRKILTVTVSLLVGLIIRKIARWKYIVSVKAMVTTERARGNTSALSVYSIPQMHQNL